MSAQIDVNRRQIRAEIILGLLNNYHFAKMFSGELYVYDYRSGVWKGEGLAESIIEARVQRVMRHQYATRYEKNEVISGIKTSTSIHRDYESDEDFWNSDPKFICVKNGVLNIETGELKKHSYEYHFRNRIPVEYIPKGDLRLNGKDLIGRTIREWVDKEEDIRSLYELAGYCLYRVYFIHIILLLVGEGANGKSTFLNLLITFLGEDNVSNESLHAICSNRFASANLSGRLANIYNDLSAGALKYTGILKMLTGGDVIDAEKKFVQHKVKFRNYAKLTFSCNAIPKVETDDTKAYWRRWSIIFFPNTFDEEQGNVDKHFLEKLCDPLELSAFLLDALDGLKRLLQNERFSNYRRTEEVRDQYILRSDPIKAFAEKRLWEDVEAYEIKARVYEAYKEFCKENNSIPVANNIFSRQLKTYVSYRDGQKTVSGKKGVTCYIGIRLYDGVACPSCGEPLDQRTQEVVKTFDDELIHHSCLSELGICPICNKPVKVEHFKTRKSDESEYTYIVAVLGKNFFAHAKCCEENKITFKRRDNGCIHEFVGGRSFEEFQREKEASAK